MAITVGKASEALNRNEVFNVVYNTPAALETSDVVYTASTGTHGVELPVNEKTQRMVIVIKGTTTSQTLHLKAGNSAEFGGMSDLEIKTGTTEGAEQAIVIDTAPYIFVSGAHKGKVCIVGASGFASCGVAIIHTM